MRNPRAGSRVDGCADGLRQRHVRQFEKREREGPRLLRAGRIAGRAAFSGRELGGRPLASTVVLAGHFCGLAAAPLQSELPQSRQVAAEVEPSQSRGAPQRLGFSLPKWRWVLRSLLKNRYRTTYRCYSFSETSRHGAFSAAFTVPMDPVGARLNPHDTFLIWVARAR